MIALKNTLCHKWHYVELACLYNPFQSQECTKINSFILLSLKLLEQACVIALPK